MQVRTEQPPTVRPPAGCRSTGTPVAVPIPRCCPEHGDWATLAGHLLDDFTNVPASVVMRELARARQSGELFRLEPRDALYCAELIVRHRVMSTTGRTSNSSSSTAPPAPLVHVA